MLDPAKLPLLQRQIWDVIERAHLDSDIQTLINRGATPDHTHEWDESLTEDGTPVSLVEMRGKDFAHLLQEIDGYLCELAGAQIRDGLHILGETPEGERLIDLLAALTRVPNLDVPGLRGALCALFGLDLDALLAVPSVPLTRRASPLRALAEGPINVNGDVIAALDGFGRRPGGGTGRTRLRPGGGGGSGRLARAATPQPTPAGLDQVTRTLTFVIHQDRRCARWTDVANVLRALEGRYVPAGPAGKPTRSMARAAHRPQFHRGTRAPCRNRRLAGRPANWRTS
ncbi:MAG: cobaltochelatase subunit CobN [Dehalococcoidia bacterium]